MRQKAEDAKAGSEAIDSRLQAVVERMFQKCYEQGHWKEAVGMALEARRLDVLENAISLAAKGNADVCRDLLLYTKESSLNVVQNLAFRDKVLALLVKLYQSSSIINEPDYLAVCQCLVFLNDHNSCSQILKKLSESNSKV